MRTISRSLFLTAAVLLTSATSEVRVGHTLDKFGAVAQLGGAVGAGSARTQPVY